MRLVARMHPGSAGLILLTACLSGFLANNAAAGDVSDLLKKMTTASENLNYQGVFVMRKSDTLTTMRVEHGADSRGVWESLESLNGETRKVIRFNEEVTSIYPNRKLLTVSHNKNKASLHPTLPGNLDKLESYYKISRLEDERIADYRAAVLDVRPNDGYRYGYRYWLDTNTGVLLKCDLLDENGDVVEQMMFTMLEYLPRAPESAFSIVDKKDYSIKRLDSGRVDVENASWQVTKLPSGFMLTQSSQRKSRDAEMQHLVYSDGLASVSVFIERGSKSHHRLDGASNMGALNVYGTRSGEYFVTVMGEVPASAVRQIAQSTEPVNSSVSVNNTSSTND
jgi:sigma-E factor negative regulatory protein RseB